MRIDLCKAMDGPSLETRRATSETVKRAHSKGSLRRHRGVAARLNGKLELWSLPRRR